MSSAVIFRSWWEASRDRDGHRTYKLRSKVRTSTKLDGPAVVMTTAGLATIGSTYLFGNDVDVWAFCVPEMEVRPLGSDEEGQVLWNVEQTFTTKPMFRCQDESIEDPLLEPPEINGSFVKYTKRATHDKDGDLIQTTSFEPIEYEVDDNRPSVTISKNVLTLPLSDITEYIDHVSDGAMWGLDARMVKFSNASFVRKLYGICTFYYTVTYEFDVNFDKFRTNVPNIGYRVLKGKKGWEAFGALHERIFPGADMADPGNWVHARDELGKEMNEKHLINADGSMWRGDALDGPPHTVLIEYYKEVDLLTELGLPTSL